MAISFSFTYSFNFSVFFPFLNIGSYFFVEEELQKCAVAAFEVSTSLNMAEYEQMLLPVSVAGATARIGKTKQWVSSYQMWEEQGQHRPCFCSWEWISAAL